MHNKGSKAAPGHAHEIHGSPVVSKHSGKATDKDARTVVPTCSQSNSLAMCQAEAVRCVRNAVLLERLTTLTEVTAQQPQHNAVLLEPLTTLAEVTEQQPQQARKPGDPRNDPRRTLSLEKERDLVTTLAFLSGISCDSDHVTAVCLQELPDEEGLKVLVAINKRTATSSSGVLNKVHAGFKKIFEQLAEIIPGMLVALFRYYGGSRFIGNLARQVSRN